MSPSRYRRLFARISGPTRRRRRSPGARLGLEALEDRTVLTFATAPIFPAGRAPVAAVSADFNGDGKADVAVVNEMARTPSASCWATATARSSPATDYAAGSAPTPSWRPISTATARSTWLSLTMRAAR